MLGTLMLPLFQGFWLQTLLFQAPIWIKAVECPWHRKVPQKIIGTMPWPKFRVAGLWFYQPRVVHGMGKRVS